MRRRNRDNIYKRNENKFIRIKSFKDEDNINQFEVQFIPTSNNVELAENINNFKQTKQDKCKTVNDDYFFILVQNYLIRNQKVNECIIIFRFINVQTYLQKIIKEMKKCIIIYHYIGVLQDF